MQAEGGSRIPGKCLGTVRFPPRADTKGESLRDIQESRRAFEGLRKVQEEHARPKPYGGLPTPDPSLPDCLNLLVT